MQTKADKLHRVPPADGRVSRKCGAALALLACSSVGGRTEARLNRPESTWSF